MWPWFANLRVWIRVSLEPHSFGLVPHLSKTLGKLLCNWLLGASGGVMVSNLNSQTYMSEFESHWVLLSYDVVPYLKKKTNKKQKKKTAPYAPGTNLWFLFSGSDAWNLCRVANNDKYRITLHQTFGSCESMTNKVS